MPRNAKFAAVLAALLAVMPHSGFADDRAEIQQAFAAYQAAIVDERNADAVALVSNSTIALYGDIRDLALYAMKDELLEQPTPIVLEVLRLRHNLNPEDLKRMSLERLVAQATDQGYIGGKGIGTTTLETINVNGASAVARLMSEDGTPTTIIQAFKEGKSWKLDWRVGLYGSSPLETIVPPGSEAWQIFILEFVPAKSGERVGPEIWQPPFARP